MYKKKPQDLMTRRVDIMMTDSEYRALELLLVLKNKDRHAKPLSLSALIRQCVFLEILKCETALLALGGDGNV